MAKVEKWRWGLYTQIWPLVSGCVSLTCKEKFKAYTRGRSRPIWRSSESYHGRRHHHHHFIRQSVQLKFVNHQCNKGNMKYGMLPVQAKDQQSWQPETATRGQTHRPNIITQLENV